jgi:hypothetical protein
MGRAYNLLSSYLSDRYQRVFIKHNDLGNCFSDWEKVKLGVPGDDVRWHHKSQSSGCEIQELKLANPNYVSKHYHVMM